MKLERCCVCDGPTGRCGEDSIFLPSIGPNGNDLGPLCEECCDAALAPFTDSGSAESDKRGAQGAEQREGRCDGE